ncbi:hypothetical protein [Candidatus Palauibacter sp.]
MTARSTVSPASIVTFMRWGSISKPFTTVRSASPGGRATVNVPSVWKAG